MKPTNDNHQNQRASMMGGLLLVPLILGFGSSLRAATIAPAAAAAIAGIPSASQSA
ncbi:MAG: hypothetical protein HC774_02425 [Sphingomonadales bacterium]|nr:hypothetical protein [Sphingomonadales bacterium]